MKKNNNNNSNLIVSLHSLSLFARQGKCSRELRKSREGKCCLYINNTAVFCSLTWPEIVQAKRFEGILSIAEDEKENDDNDEDADDIFVCLWAPKSRKACDTNTHTHTHTSKAVV